MQNTVTGKKFQCYRDNLVIRGMEYLPEGNHLPVIIMSHGFAGNYKHFTGLCQTFASWGYATFAYDFCGGSAGDEGTSDGSSLDMTVGTECSDLLEVIGYVRSLPYINQEKITLIGHSQGGLVSALTAARQQEHITFESLILLSPALCIPDHARAGGLAGASYNVNNVPDIIDCGSMQISRKFHDYVVHMDVFHEIAPYKGRVLIIHGLLDDIVSYQYAVQAAETYGANQCHLELMKDVGHGYTQPQNESILASIHQFLQLH